MSCHATLQLSLVNKIDRQKAGQMHSGAQNTGFDNDRAGPTSLDVTARHSDPSSASLFCRLVLGPCGLHSGMLVLPSPRWTVMHRLWEAEQPCPCRQSDRSTRCCSPWLRRATFSTFPDRQPSYPRPAPGCQLAKHQVPPVSTCSPKLKRSRVDQQVDT